ncbi:putative transcription factor FAR family [Helianthus debilis subsp. tardiflorus]
MEDNSDKSEELLEDDGGDHEINNEQVFEIGNDGLETASLFGIEGDDMENDSELVLDIETDDHENDSEQILEFENNGLDDKDQMLEFGSKGHDSTTIQLLEIETNNQEKHNLPPVVGMEFDSYEDAYKFYNLYAIAVGFAIRVKSSWTKRNSKEKRGAVLCCNCEGFKTLKEASSRRKETRTGCLAMIRLKLTDSNRWRVDEVKLDHNHSFDPERAQTAKSHKKTESRLKRKSETNADVEVRTIKLYRTPVADNSMVPFFHGYVHQQTSLKEFFEMHDLVFQNKIQKEAFDDIESKESNPKPRTMCTFESQLSKLYTKEIFSLFQYEVEMMSHCFHISQTNTTGSIVTYTISEQETKGNIIRSLEVMYDKIGTEVRCICSCYNFRGYLCRHALCVLNHNGVDEIPSQYILSRWRKDFKRMYVPDLGSNNVDVTNPVQRFEHLHKRALQVVEEGMTSLEHYTVAWQAFKESLNKVRLVADKNVE